LLFLLFRGGLQPFASVVEYVNVKSDLFPIFQKLVKDDQDSVRLLTVNAAENIAKLFKTADNVTKMLPVIQSSFCLDKSWRVRYMIADKFCELCQAMGGEMKSDELVDGFVRLLTDEEAEVRTAAAQRVGSVSQLFGAQQTTRKLLAPLRALVKDQSQYVRAALASVIMSIAPVINRRDTYDQLVPLFLILLKDTNSEVRLNLISRLESITTVMNIDQLAASLLPAIMES
jgi:serine/threonine-protein phosphatase 2A regulatory subunit A